MTVALIYDPSVAEYRFPAGHPMQPERFTLAVSLMREWGLLEPPADSTGAPGRVPRAPVWAPSAATEDDALLIHSADYLAALKAADAAPEDADPAYGLGPGDTPAFRGVLAASLLAVGGTCLALDSVLDGRATRTFSPAGGLHHAAHDRASGFCTLNDCAIAIERAIRARPELRIAYVDIDAHHGDGVEAAFRHRDDVLTVSLHESGRYLFPGTGAARDIGEGAGRGYAVNVALPPGAGPDEFASAFRGIVVPAVHAFAPDAIVAQLGADSHRGDPLTHLENTIEGHARLVGGIVDLAEEVCSGRVAATGGGGYQPFSAVPRMWACAMARLMGATIPAEVPMAWLVESRAAAGGRAEMGSAATFDDGPEYRDLELAQIATDLTRQAIEETAAASPLLSGTPS